MMPQIWVTDHELSAYLDCSPFEARELALSGGWKRKRSRDGLPRTCLPETLMISYVLDVVRSRLGAPPAPPLYEARHEVRQISNSAATAA